jgi:hypothetical protein
MKDGREDRGTAALNMQMRFDSVDPHPVCHGRLPYGLRPDAGLLRIERAQALLYLVH